MMEVIFSEDIPIQESVVIKRKRTGTIHLQTHQMIIGLLKLMHLEISYGTSVMEGTTMTSFPAWKKQMMEELCLVVFPVQGSVAIKRRLHGEARIFGWSGLILWEIKF